MKKYILACFAFIALTSYTSAAITTDLQVGSQGDQVSELQKLLIEKGFNIESISLGKVSPGYFGLQTKLAVIAFQNSQGLPSTGYVGPLTRAKLGNSQNMDGVTLTSPNGSEEWEIGSTQKITWKKNGNVTAKYVDIRLDYYYPPCTMNPCPMTTSIAPYQSPRVIAEHVNIDKLEYVWTVGQVQVFSYEMQLNENRVPPKSLVEAGNFKIQICETDSSRCDESDHFFKLYEKVVPQVGVLTPNGGEKWPSRSIQTISWNNLDKSKTSKVDLYLTSSCHATGTSACPAPYILDKKINSNKTYNWIVATDINDDPIPDGEYKVMVCQAGQSPYYHTSTPPCDESYTPFWITSAVQTR